MIGWKDVQNVEEHLYSQLQFITVKRHQFKISKGIKLLEWSPGDPGLSSQQSCVDSAYTSSSDA